MALAVVAILFLIFAGLGGSILILAGAGAGLKLQPDERTLLSLCIGAIAGTF